MTSTLYCAACHRPLEAGEALRVTEARTGRSFVVCRAGISPRCFGRVRFGDVIRLADPDAARALDARLGGLRARPSDDVRTARAIATSERGQQADEQRRPAWRREVTR